VDRVNRYAAALKESEGGRELSELGYGTESSRRTLVAHCRSPVGPYRFIRHPNFAMVAVGILAIPMLCGSHITAVAFSVVNAIFLRTRIRAAQRALPTLAGC